MAFEYPFNFVAKTTAKASEVMANFNAVKTVLEAGIDLENLAPGIAPTAGQWEGGAVNTAAASLSFDLLTGGEQEFELPVKSKVLFSVMSYLRGAYYPTAAPERVMAAYLYVDGIFRANAELKSSRTFNGEIFSVAAKVSDTALLTLAAGAHRVRVLGAYTEPNFITNQTKVEYIAIPTP